MKSFRRFLVALCVVFSGVAWALTPSERVLLFAGIKPIAYVNLTSTTSLTFPAWLASSRTSNGTLFDATATLTDGPNNGAVYGADWGAAGWAKSNVTIATGISDPVGGTNAVRVTATSNNAYVGRYAAIISNTVTSFWARRVSGSGTVNQFSIAGGTGTVMALSGSWQQFYTAGPNSGGTAYVGLGVIATSGDVVDVYLPVIANVTYETTPRASDQVLNTGATAYNGPRFDTDPATSLARGLLTEGSRTNLVFPSRSLASWVQQNTATTNNAAVSIDGTTGAAKVQASAGSGPHSTYKAISLAANTTVSVSAVLSPGTSRYAALTYANSSGKWIAAVFDLQGGSTATQTGAGAGGTFTSSRQQTLSNGFGRCTLTGQIQDASGAFEIGIAPAATGNTFNGFGEISFTAAGTEYLYADFAQAEAASFSESIIQTISGTVARAADSLTQSTHAAKAQIWERQSIATGVIDRIYYAPGAVPSPMTTDYWYRKAAVYSRALTTAEQTAKLVVGAPL